MELKYKVSSSFDTLFDFLRDRAELAGTVKKLYLYKKIEGAKYRAPGGLSLLMVSDDYAPLFDHPKVIGLLSKMPNLRKLILQDIKAHEPRYTERTIGYTPKIPYFDGVVLTPGDSLWKQTG